MSAAQHHVVYLRQKYSEDEPRVPAGGPGGGEWAGVEGVVKDKLAGLGMSDYRVAFEPDPQPLHLNVSGWEGATTAGRFNSYFTTPGAGTGMFTFILPAMKEMSTEQIRGLVEHEASHARMFYANAKSSAVLRFIEENAVALRSEDGNTAYSSAWWQKAANVSPPHGPYSTWRQRESIGGNSDFYQAINESLAEMHKTGVFSSTYAKLDKIILAQWGRRGIK